jgi:hypothetical protein
LFGEASGLGDVIRVHASQIAASRTGPTRLERRYDAPRRLVDHADPRVFSSPRRKKPRAVVRRTIVHSEHLEVLERLSTKRGDALRQVRRSVAYRE